MTLDSGTIIGIVSILFTLCSVIFLAGSIPEKIKTCNVDLNRIEREADECRQKVELNAEKANDSLRRELEKAIEEHKTQQAETIKRVHSRLDAISVHFTGVDGTPVFVSKSECRDKRADITDQASSTQNLICTMLERMESKFERAMTDWAKALNNQQAMLSEIMLIKTDMKALHTEINGIKKA